MVDRTLTVYKEGLLFKRQRGLHKSNTKALKFQERFCRLTSTSLDYYDPNPRKRSDGPKGQFAVDRVRIVEVLSGPILGKEYPYVFQIGDNTEVMYLAARSQRERDYWIESFRKAASDARNQLLSHYHHGVFGVANKGRWSCCGNPQRTCHGCTIAPGYRARGEAFIRSYPPTHHNPTPTKDRSATLPLDVIPPPSPLQEGQLSTSTASNKTLTESTSIPKANPTPIPKPGVPLIRSFTFADPVMQRPNLKRIKELRASKGITRDYEDLLGGSLPERSSFASMDSCKDSDITELVKSKLGLLHHVSPKKADDLGELSKIAQELQGNFSQDGSSRSGASSPAPSTDSGKGASAGSSRPGSQVISALEIENRIRNESIGKRSDLSVQSDQGVVPDGEGSKAVGIARQTAVDEPGGPDTPIKLDKRESEISVFTDEEEGPQTPRDLSSATQKPPTSTPSPLTVENLSQSTPDNETLYKRREVAVSISLENIADKRMSMFSAESVSSTLLRPRQRNASTFIDEQGRPKSILLPRTLPPLFSRLHRACKEGNLAVLDEELSDENVNLEETSLGPVPYTPLFLAFLNDHYQSMVRLLERGANPNGVESVDGASVLHRACRQGCLDVVELLLQYSIEVNQEDSSGNTPLMEACKNGHKDIVELLLRNGAEVDHESGSGRTPLHEASEAGHNGITELLVKEGGADPILRDQNDATPYDLAFNKGYKEVMQILRSVIPESVRPYSLICSHSIPSAQMVTSLTFKGSDVLISGSKDCHVSFWNTSDLTLTHHVRMLDTVLSVHLWRSSLAVGSTSTQLINMDNHDRRRTIVDTSMEVEDEDLEDPPLHVVGFGAQGRLATAAVEGNVVKLWPPVSPKSNIITLPDSNITVGQEQQQAGCIYCLTMSPTPTCPWLAVGLQPGKIFKPSGNKLVYLLDWKTRKVQHIFDGGDGGLSVSLHMMFSPDGQCLAIGCAENLCIWETSSGALLHKFATNGDSPVTGLSYSPDGAHLAAGLYTGEVQVFEISSSGPIFTLEKPQRTTPVTAISYSEDGRLLAVGHQNGLLQLWEAYTGQPSND